MKQHALIFIIVISTFFSYSCSMDNQQPPKTITSFTKETEWPCCNNRHTLAEGCYDCIETVKMLYEVLPPNPEQPSCGVSDGVYAIFSAALRACRNHKD